MSEFDKFVGIPYLDKGRTIDGLDCWGLLRLVYLELLKIELPSYSESYITGADRTEISRLISGNLGDWTKVERGKEEPFDGLLMREGKLPRHIGVVTSPGMVLHIENSEAASSIERYRYGILANRVVGFYRHASRVK